jgi:hypothetical protein
MSSSDARPFLRAFAGVAALLIAAALAATWLLDPFGLLALGGWRGPACAAGARGVDERFTKPIVPRLYLPEEVVVGSSRAFWMLREETIAGPTGHRVANLSVSGASIDEIDQLVTQALADAPVRRVWIGADFGAFAMRDEQARDLLRPWAIGDRRLTALRYGLFHPRALSAAFLALGQSHNACADPPVTASGFARHPPVPEGQRPALRPDRAARAILAERWRMPAAERARLIEMRFARFEALLARLERRGVAVVIFLTPSPPAYLALVEEAGLGGDYRRWRRRLLLRDRAAGVTVVASDSPEFLDSVARTSCAGRDREACLFYDLTHARPPVGAAIVRAALGPAPRQTDSPL